MTTNGRGQHPPVGAALAEAADGRRALLDQVRQVATDMETAQRLERRADRSPNPALAARLRERALGRRRRAARLRADLARHGNTLRWLPPSVVVPAATGRTDRGVWR